VLSKFKAPLGGELNSSYVGGSAMPVEVANFFENIGTEEGREVWKEGVTGQDSSSLLVSFLSFFPSGVAICEGYGLTETSPLICVNPFNVRVRRMGTVRNPPFLAPSLPLPLFLNLTPSLLFPSKLQVGQLIGDADVRIIKDGKEVEPGEEGEIWVSYFLLPSLPSSFFPFRSS
jgi:acyl-CoA synthetase (AMP-forming)/AMP-acid ligase II